MKKLWICNGLGSNMKFIGEFSTFRELKKEGKKLLREGAMCSESIPAREFAYQDRNGLMTYEWIK